MLTHKTVDRLAKDMHRQPVLPVSIYKALQYSRQSKESNSMAYKACITLGLLSPKGGMTKVGRFYYDNAVRMFK